MTAAAPHRALRVVHAAAPLAGTLALLAAIERGPLLLGGALAWWAIALRPIRGRELIAALGVDALFATMDVAAVRAGQFRFHDPALLGLPVWEFVMWGFFVVQGQRLLVAGGAAPRPRPGAWEVATAGLFAAPYTLVRDPLLLALIPAAVALLACCRQPRGRDLAAALGSGVMGALVETTGVLANHWSYPEMGRPPMPAWSLVMWAGIGVFADRILGAWLTGPAAAGAAAEVTPAP